MEKDSMNDKFLFSLDNCVKCTKTKELLKNRQDIEIVIFPYDLNMWSDEQIEKAKFYDVFDDLQKTAPILYIDGDKKIGYLRIRKWLMESDNKID
jgi:glutaredoxin